MDAQKRPTRDDVARKAGVSSAVVSYVLNNGPRPVADHTRHKVLEAVRELRYRPNSAARAFRLQKSNSIGLLVPDISNPFFAELASTIREAASAYGCALILNDSGSTSSITQDQIRFISERQPDGVVIIGRTAQTNLEALRTNRIRCVALDAAQTGIRIPTVSIDNYAAALSGIEHLKQHGHSQIAMIAGSDDSIATDARVQAWCDATGMPTTSPLLRRSDYSREGGLRACQELLNSSQKFTALFVASDIQAIGALRALQESSIAIPNDCAVVSFDGTQEARFTTPPLTVIEQPLTTMAERALALLFEEPEEQPKSVLVEHSLITRDSCGCSCP